eukprot:5067430-Amphidinium_carterae.1
MKFIKQMLTSNLNDTKNITRVIATSKHFLPFSSTPPDPFQSGLYGVSSSASIGQNKLLSPLPL